VTSECHELEVALSLRAVGALDADEGARLEAHLAGCPGCRAELERTTALLDLARLPPPTLAEHRALSDLSVRVASAMRPEVAPVRAGSGLRSARRLAAGILVASGVAAVAIVPLVVRRQRPPAAATEVSETASASPGAQDAEGKNGESGWQEPDLDTLWQDAAVVSLASEDG
jgi:anti-sigma factor RsiW